MKKEKFNFKNAVELDSIKNLILNYLQADNISKKNRYFINIFKINQTICYLLIFTNFIIYSIISS